MGGNLEVTLMSNGKSIGSFGDKTIVDNKGTSNVCYEVIVDLTTVSEGDVVSVMIKWLIANGNGNISSS